MLLYTVVITQFLSSLLEANTALLSVHASNGAYTRKKGLRFW